MDWKRGFTYIFEDRNWFKKMFIGSLVTAVPVVESISNGYQLQVIENIRSGDPRPLPEWAGMDRMFGKGFKLWAAVNLFYIPSIIVSVISWILGIPYLLSLIADLLATSATNDPWYRHGITTILPFVVSRAVVGLGILLGSVFLPAVFFFVPAMAVRCQETGSLLSTLNIVEHSRFILRNLGEYITSRVLIACMLFGMSIFASVAGGVTVWIAGLGILVAWFLTSAGRFWSRLAWAYFLAHIRMDEQGPAYVFHLVEKYPTHQFGNQDVPALALTPLQDNGHYWGNNS